MNSPSRSAAPITARFIAPVTSKPGGKQAGIDPLKIARKLWKHTRMRRADGLRPTAPTQDAAADRPAESDGQGPASTSAQPSDSLPTNMLTEIALCGDLFHTAAGTAFADILVNDHRETWPIRSKRFRSWLRRCHYEATGEAASAAAIRSALDLLEARAQFDGPERAVHIRTAEHAGRIYLDLADEHWRAVEIGPDGWRVIGSPAGPLPPAGRDVAAASTGARRLD